MIIVNATLTAAAKVASRMPYVEAKVYERLGIAYRHTWTRYYTGAEVAGPHAACMPADGSLIRAYIVQDGAVYDLSYQRVTSPAVGSTYSSWSDLVTDISPTGGVALATTGTTVSIFYVANDNVTIKQKVSTDSGATFAAAVDVDVAPANVIRLAAAYKNSTTLALFYATAASVRVVVYSAGAWGTDAAWTNSANSITGLAVVRYNDYNLIVTGTDTSDNPRVWSTIYGDDYAVAAGDWSSLEEIIGADNGSNVSFSYPTVSYPDTFRTLFLEEYSGTGSYSRIMASHTRPSAGFIDNQWREPWPMSMSNTYGLALVKSSSTAWLTTPSGVWRATIAPAVLDMTANLLAIDARVDEYSGSLVAVFRNDNGQYLTTGSGKGSAWLGCEIRLGIGYKTTAGNEAATHLSFWVDDYAFQTGPGVATFTLHASSPWQLLERWKARRQFKWAAGATTAQVILTHILARAGLELSAVGASSQAGALTPAFTINPGESGAAAAKRLLALLPDRIHFQNAYAIMTEHLAADAADYALGTTHTILAGSYRTGAIRPNRVQVYADGALGEALDQTQIDLLYDSLAQFADLRLSAEADADDRADAELRSATMASKSDVVEVPTIPALEMYDVLALTDARAELSAAKRRVLGFRTTYDARKRKYSQTLILGEP